MLENLFIELMINPYYSWWGWVAGGIENNANSVQLQLQLPTGTELGNTSVSY